MIYVAVNNSRAVSGKVPEPTGDEESKRAVDKIWRDFNGCFENRQVSAEEFMRLVTSGYAFTAQHNRYRHSKNFIQAQHLALDMDHVGMSLEQVSQVPFFKRFANFAYTTPSHREDNPRLRVVFILDRPIKDKQKYAELAAALVGRFGMTDQSVKDPARFFYGSLGALHHWFGNIMTLEDAATELVFPDRRIKEQAKQVALETAANRVVIPAGNVSSRLLQIHSEKLLSRVRTAQDGEKYFTLRNTAIAFGGYIANNYYRRDDVQMWLEAAIAANGNNVRSMEAAIKCIEKGIDYGVERPLHFEVNQTPSGDYPELERVHPPLTPQQKEAVARIIADKEWQAYHDGMTAGDRQRWTAMGIPESFQDLWQLGYTNGTLTIPHFSPGWQLSNIEYMPVGSDELQRQVDVPSCWLSYPDEEPTGNVILFPQTVDAAVCYVSMVGTAGYELSMASMPGFETTSEGISQFDGCSSVTVVVDPSSKQAAATLLPVAKRVLGNKVRVTDLPDRAQRLVQLYGYRPETMMNYVNQARVF